MIDVARLRKELEHITAHPEEWDQEQWLKQDPRVSCGTVGCLAGNTVLHAGDLPMWYNGHASSVRTAEGKDRRMGVEERAAELLGLSEVQAARLFHSSNSLRLMWQYAQVFTHGEIQVPDDLPEWADMDPEEVHCWIKEQKENA